MSETAAESHDRDEQPRPAWSLPDEATDRVQLQSPWPSAVARDWAWGESRGRGARVCVVDSGIDRDHPLIGEVQSSCAVVADGEQLRVVPDEAGDLCGHGNACAGIIRSLAPECELHSVRVLGAGFTGSGPILLEGLRWAVERGFDVINMSLSTTKRQFSEALHELADSAYFKRTLIVAAAHNMPVESFPWRFSSVISVGCHERADPRDFYANPDPPVEFFARGIDVEVAWTGGGSLRSSGNSFATPHITGLCALILARHPGLTPFEVKHILYQTANNVGGNRE